jgi:poly(A) polymerase
VSAGKPFEITTLRRDVATDGRHAEVIFTDDWTADAARRDFTVNAMSADRDGVVDDYFGGQEDLVAGRIRFVGNAAARVEEDYLRILRFFRFHAWYGNGSPDGDGLAACAAGIAGLSKVSAERVRTELLRLLSAPDPRHALKAMNESCVLKALVHVDGADLSGLVDAERTAGRAPDPLIRLAALAPGHMTLATDLRLSNAEAAILRSLAPPWSDLGSAPVDWRRGLYRMGQDGFERRALLAASIGETSYLTPRLAAASGWKKVTLPIKGRDLIALGLPVGPMIGKMIDGLENWWIDQDFAEGREAMLQEAKRRIDAQKEIP